MHASQTQEELAELVVAAQGGDRAAFERIVERFTPYAKQRAYSFLKDRQLAEDAVQEAFLEASQKLYQLQIPAAFPGWFKRIVFKRCDRLTRGKKLPMVSLDALGDPGAEAESPEAIDLAEEARIVREALETLPVHEREIARRYYLDLEPQKDIAEALGLPVTTVKKRMYSARQRMKRKLATWLERDGAETEPDDAATDEQLDNVFNPRIQVFMAVCNGFGQKVDMLLRKHPELVHGRNDDGMSLLLYAAHCGHHRGDREMADRILRHGANPGPYASAALGELKRIIERFAYPAARQEQPGVWGRSPLHWAVSGGHDALVAWMIDHGANVNRPDQWGCTPLHLAADFGRRRTAQVLLERGADVRNRMRNGKTAYHLAASRGDNKLVALLQRHGVKPDLFGAAAAGDLALAKKLLKKSPNGLNETLALGASPLHLAAESGRTEMADFLIARGAKMDLLAAAELNRIEDIDRIAGEAPEQLNATGGSFGFTPLHYACMRGREALVRRLLSRGANVNNVDRMYSKTPLEEALFFGRERVADLLRRHGAGGDPAPAV